MDVPAGVPLAAFDLTRELTLEGHRDEDWWYIGVTVTVVFAGSPETSVPLQGRGPTPAQRRTARTVLASDAPDVERWIESVGGSTAFTWILDRTPLGVYWLEGTR